MNRRDFLGGLLGTVGAVVAVPFPLPEVGEWTPVFQMPGSLTMIGEHGQYVRVGSLVTINFVISSLTGKLVLAGLPFLPHPQ